MAKSKSSRSEDFKGVEQTIAFAQNLFEAREDKWDNKSYQCTLLGKKGVDRAIYEKAVVEACVKQWGDKAVGWIKEGIIKSPFLDGDSKQGKYLNEAGELVAKPGFAGHWFIRCKSGEQFKPKVFDRRVLPIVDKDGCPSGSTGIPVLNAFTWENEEQGKGVTFGISMFQVTKVATGDEILGGGGGAADPDKFFEKIEGADAPDETKGGQGASGLFE